MNRWFFILSTCLEALVMVDWYGCTSPRPKISPKSINASNMKLDPIIEVEE